MSNVKDYLIEKGYGSDINRNLDDDLQNYEPKNASKNIQISG